MKRESLLVKERAVVRRERGRTFGVSERLAVDRDLLAIGDQWERSQHIFDHDHLPREIR